MLNWQLRGRIGLMGRLYLIRHGQASLGSENYDQLSKLGKQQARLLGEYFKLNKIHFDQVLCGSQVRHQESAQHFLLANQTTTDNPLLILKQFNEFNFEAIIQAYLGINPEQTLTQFKGPGLFQLLKKSLLSWSQGELNLGEDESWEDFQHRLSQGLSQIQSEFHQQDILLFTSGGPISHLVSQVLNTPKKTCIDLNLQIQNSSVTQFLITQESVTLHSFNELAHLQAPDRMSLRSYS